MTMYQRPDSHIPEEVDNDIIASDWIKNNRVVISLAMLEVTMDGILGFPFLHKLMAWGEALFRLFSSN